MMEHSLHTHRDAVPPPSVPIGVEEGLELEHLATALSEGSEETPAHSEERDTLPPGGHPTYPVEHRPDDTDVTELRVDDGNTEIPPPGKVPEDLN